MVPQAPTIASHGLTRISARPSIGRAPSLSSRVKQSCMLRKCVFLASRKSRSVNSRHTPIDASRTSGCSIRLNQPINCVASRRGIRLVRRKLMSSCCKTRSSCARTVMGLSTPARKPRFDHGHNDLRHIGVTHDHWRHDGLRHGGLRHGGLRHGGLRYGGLGYDNLGALRSRRGGGNPLPVLTSPAALSFPKRQTPPPP